MRESATRKPFRRKKHTADTEINRIRQKYRLQMIWLFPLISALIVLLSSMFIDGLEIRILLSLILAAFPWLAITDKLFSMRYKHLRTQLLVFMQSMCTSVSSGYSTERALMQIRPIIEHTFSKKSVLIRPLIKLEHNINMHRDLGASLKEFAESLSFPEIIPVFHALGISGKIGNNSLEILRSSCQMLSEMNCVQDEINAQNSGKNAEAVLLCIMPFAITFALNNMSSNYVGQAKSTPAGSVLMAVAFALCIIASALLFRYMTHSDITLKTIEETDSTRQPQKLVFTPIIKKYTPIGFISSRYEMFSELDTDPQRAYEAYLKKQVITNLILTPMTALILTLAGKSPLFALLAPPVITYLNFSDTNRKVNIRKEEIMRDIPLFLCLLTTLLEAGIMLPRATEICSDAFPNNKSLSFEIRHLRAMILSGIPASDAVEKMSLRIKVPEAQAALLLVSRYGRLGTSEVLNLLALQSSACWNLCRNAARKKQERESLWMILPMTLDFICVLLVATTPAIISLGI